MGGALPQTLTQLGQAARGAAHGVGSFFNNAANLVESGVAAGANAIPGVHDSAVGNWLASTAKRDVDAQAASDQQFRQTASPGEQAAEFVAPVVLPLGAAADAGTAISRGVTALPGMSGALVRMLGAGLGGAATGAALSAGTPVSPDQPYWPQVGQNALTGASTGFAVPAVLSGVGDAAGAIANAARPLRNPRDYVGHQFAGVVGDDAARVAANIRSAPTYVPGSQPTLAQVGATPTLVATEKALANASPDFKVAFAQRGIDNNDARWQSLMDIAQTPQALDAATQARAAGTQPLYDVAHQATANVGPAFMRYAQIPEMQEAMRRANSLASLDASVGRGVAPVWPTPPTVNGPGSRAINGAALDYTSRVLGDMIGEANRAGSDSRAAALTTLKGKVDSWMQTYVPGVQQARDAYAAASVPVNTMEAGQQIANSARIGTGSMNTGGVPQIELAAYRDALARALRNQPYGIDAGALGALQGIGQDLQRSTIANGLKSPGSDTAYNVAANGWLAQRMYGPNFQGGAFGRALGAALQAGGAAGGAALFGPAGAGVGSALGSGIGAMLSGSRVGTRVNEQLADFLLNPQGFLPYLDAHSASATASPQVLGHALAGYVRYAPALVAPQLPQLIAPGSQAPAAR